LVGKTLCGGWGVRWEAAHDGAAVANKHEVRKTAAGAKRARVAKN